MDGLIPDRLRKYDEPAKLVFVHAHPDDESITTAITMARHVGLGDEVTLVTCTRGELGEVIPPELQDLEVAAPTTRNPGKAVDTSGDALAAERIRELSHAMEALGVTDHRFLGDRDAHDPRIGRRRYKDSGMGKPGSPYAELNLNEGNRAYRASLRSGEEIFASGLYSVSNPSRHRQLFIEEALHLAYVIRTIRPDAVISYSYDGGYGHPDHIRASEITCEAVNYAAIEFPDHYSVELDLPAWAVPLQYFIRDCYPGSGDRISEDPDGELVAVHATPSEYRKKQSAMAAHRTQIILDGKGRYALSNGIWDEVGASEEYTLVRDPCENLKGIYDWSRNIAETEIPEILGVTELIKENLRCVRKKPEGKG